MHRQTITNRTMNTAFIIAVSLGVAVVMTLLMLIAAIIYLRWRISDNNVHLERFITENTELRAKVDTYFQANSKMQEVKPK